jgi:hypothetical protein
MKSRWYFEVAADESLNKRTDLVRSIFFTDAAAGGREVTKAVSHNALHQVMRRHGLKPKNGFYSITDDMVAEAQAIDAAAGYKATSLTDPGWKKLPRSEW